MEEFIGKVFTKIDNTGDKIIFHCENGDYIRMYHEQACCESVYVEDIVGDLEDLIGTPILEAREDTEQGGEHGDSTYTWTFYNFRTIKGSVTIRWYGTSNGYYSESVHVELVKHKN